MNNNEQDQMSQNNAAPSLLFEPDLSDATIKRALAPFLSIDSDSADASEQARTSSEDAGAAHSSGAEAVTVADTADTGYYAKSAWDESVARISRLLASSWSNVPLSEAGQQVESALDAVEEDLRLFSDLTSYFGRNGMTSGVAVHRLSGCLAKLQDAELAVHQPKGGAHQALPWFPRFLSLSARVLNEGIESGVLDKKSGTVQVFFKRANDYLESARESAFSERRLKITLELAGPRKELAYIYDWQTEQSLTEWVPLTGDSAPTLLRTQDILRDRVAEAFVQKLPFAEMQAALVTISGARQAPTDWSELRELLIRPGLLPEDGAEPDAAQGASEAQEGAQQGEPQTGEKIVVTRAAIRDLLLPDVRAQYVPELGPDAKSAAARIDFKPMAASVLSSFTNEVVQSQITKVTKKVLASLPLGAVAPGIGIILDVIFPSDPPITKAEMEAEIDKRVKKALDNEALNTLKVKFENCRDVFDLRMQSIRNKNRDENGNLKPNQANWDIGPPEAWEHFIGETGELQKFLFANPSRYYITHQLLTDAMTLRLSAIYGKLQAAKPSDEIGVELRLLNECFTGWYLYLEKLLDFAWHKTVGSKDFEVIFNLNQDLIGTIFNQHHLVVDSYNNKKWVDQYKKALSDSVSKSKLNYPAATIKKKAVVYGTLNTALRNMCRAYDAAVSKHNEKFNTNLPLAVGPIFDWWLGDSWYKPDMNHYVRNNPFNDGGGKDRFTWSPYRGNYLRDGKDFLREDLFIETVSKSGKQRWYSVGDYADLKLDGNDAVEMAEMKFPRGFRAICYSEANFGQYLDDKGNVHYKGTHWVLPSDGMKPHLVVNGKDVRSMKVRIELEFWHNARNVYGRIKDWQWADKTKNPPQVADLEIIDVP